MSDTKRNQSTDSAQGGEGTNSFNGKSYSPLTKDIGRVANTQAPVPDPKVGAK